MSEKDFLINVAEVLEADAEGISLNTDFRNDIPDWGSLKGYSLIVMIEDEYGVVIEVEDFLKAKTVGDLYRYTLNGKLTVNDRSS